MYLYHGTSISNLHHILDEDMLLTATTGDPAVCTSHELGPAEYWANLTASQDASDPVIILLDVKKLLINGYELIPFSDPIYGEGKCDWECEVRVYEDIHPLSAVMKGYEEIARSDVRGKSPGLIAVLAEMQDEDQGSVV